jgi:MFS family permease
VLLLALAPDPVAWILLRGVIGFSLAILYTTIESWLNDKVPNRQRGQVLSVYMMINLLAMAAGQMLFPLLDVASIVPFVLIAIPMILSLVPVSLSTATQPNPPSTIRLDLRALYRLSPLALIGCFAIGLANGAFWGLAPLFARSILADSLGVSLFMTSAVIGGAAAQWPLGFLSDRVDRRFVIAGVGFAAAIGGAALTVGSGLSLAPLCLLAAGFGACLFPLYSLCVAHANDFAPAEDFVATSGGLLLVYGIAAAIGPLAASAVMEVLGPGGVFVWAGAVHCIVAVYAVFRMRKRRAKSADARAALVPLTKTTPAAFEIDPRAARKAD